MTQTFSALETGVTTFGTLYGILNNNQEALRTCFSGTSFPSNPTTPQLCIRTDVAPWRIYLHTGGDVWTDITDYMPDFQALLDEVEAARGTAAALNTRLAVSINPDGTLKGSAPVGDWWATEADTVAYDSSTTFTVEGDKTAIYLEKRAIYLTQTSNAYTHVSDATYDEGSDLTTVTTVDAVVDSGLSAVEYGQPTNNATYNGDKADKVSGATSGNLAGLDANGNLTDTGVLAGRTGFKNQIINGGFFVNQRGYVSGTNTTSANEYTLDRWRVVTSGQSVTWTDLGGKRTVTVPAGGVEQVIEGAFLPAGTYTISWEGTATCAVDGTARTNGESFSVAGGSNVTVKFSDGTVANAQLEAGSVATPFEQRLIGIELGLCQRYYETGTLDRFVLTKTAQAETNESCSGTFLFKAEKRGIPTLVISGVTNYTEGPTYAGEVGFTLIGSFTATGVLAYFTNYTADAEL